MVNPLTQQYAPDNETGVANVLHSVWQASDR